MDRRTFIKSVFGSMVTGFGPAMSWDALGSPGPRKVLQESPLAGFQFYNGGRLWRVLRAGTPLRLVREADNPYDCRAVAVFVGDYKLGYVPRRENRMAACMLDHGYHLAGRIVLLKESHNPWERIRLVLVVW